MRVSFVLILFWAKPPRARPGGGWTAPRAGMVLVFLFIGRFLCFDAGALCGAAGPTNGRLAPSHADVARVIRLMLSAVLKSLRTTSVWLLAWRWPPACRFAAAPNL